MNTKPTYEELEQRVKKLEQETSQQKRLSNDLVDSEERFRALADTSPLAIYMSEGIEQKSVYINPTFTKLFGYTIEEVPSVDQWWPLAYPDANYRKQIADEWQKKVEHAIETNSEIEPMDVVVTCKDGSKKNISWGFITLGKQNWACGFDMTKLIRSERRFTTIFEQAPLGIALIDSFSGHIYEVNPRFAEIAGRTIGEMVTIDWMSITHPDDVQEDLDNMASLNAGEIDGFQMRKRYRRPEGTYVSIIMTIAPLKELDGSHSRHLCMIDDITEQIEAEKAKEQMEDKLRQATKMQAIGTLAGGVAHEFNNLLAVIIGTADMARDEVSVGSFARGQLDQTLKASFRARDLVKQILTFSRQKFIQKPTVPHNLGSLVRETLSLVRSSSPSSVDININEASNCNPVMVDSSEVSQILMNLCSNAVWAMREKGVITISIEQIDLNKKMDAEVLGLEVGQYLKLSVSDTGKGMDDATRERLFEPFFTTKDVGQGTGMGLATVTGIVENYGGVITVESEEGKGTTFDLYFPTVEDTSPQTEPTPTSEAEHTGESEAGKEKILFVDDEPMFMKTGKDMLESLGYEVIAETDSRVALNTFKARPQDFDLVITDQIMPHLSGDDLTKEFLAIRSDLPIILCTGQSDQMDEEKAKSIGIKEFIMKPIVKKDIAKLLRKVLDAQ